MKTTLFLGAGFSKSAGIPLASELFNELPYCPTNSKNLILKYEAVFKAWEKVSNINVEEWLCQVYLKKTNANISLSDILNFISARIVSLPRKYGKNGAYYYGISTSIDNAIHQNFWTLIRQKFDLNAIITTNYDLVIEQGLRDEYSSGTNNRKAPSCKYGGFPFYFEQRIRIMTNIATGKEPSEFREDILRGIELFKLHGSLNWVEEPHGFKIHDDVRAVFRVNEKLGKPRIIPPLEEKEKPEWAHDIWNYAQRRITESDNLFICGYSFPEYDKATRNLLANATTDKKRIRIFISDPNNETIKQKLQSVIKCECEYILLQGLPEINNWLNSQPFIF